ncbi:hypothetical protein JXM67_02550 [candidate division WOR-3 bacterium]|nr:hypothetical protein [candidate division WOR-3 bacterium]
MEPEIKITIISTSGAAVLGFLTRIIVELFRRRRIKIETKLSPKVEIREVTDKDDPDFDCALDLVKRRIPPNERVRREEMERWIEEAQTKEHRKRKEEYFLVAKIRPRNNKIVEDVICGFLYAEYSLSQKYLFITYLVVDDNNPFASENNVSNELFKYLKRKVMLRFRHCKGVLFEIAKGDSLRNRARMRLFRRIARREHLELKEIDIDYKQPSLYIWETSEFSYHEEEISLIYGSFFSKKKKQSYLSRDKVIRILNYIYREAYGGHFEDNLENQQKYQNYLNGLFSRVVKTLPETVQLEKPGEF